MLGSVSEACNMEPPAQPLGVLRPVVGTALRGGEKRILS